MEFIYDTTEVWNECVRFYSKLYDSNKPDVNEINIYLSENTENANKLNNIEKGIWEQPIDSNKLDDVVNSRKTKNHQDLMVWDLSFFNNNVNTLNLYILKC